MTKGSLVEYDKFVHRSLPPLLYDDEGTRPGQLNGSTGRTLLQDECPVVLLDATSTVQYPINNSNWQKTKILTSRGEAWWIWVNITTF